MEPEPNLPLVFMPADATTHPLDGAFAVIVRTREEFVHWLNAPAPSLDSLQVEGLLDDPEVWAIAAQGPSAVPLDVVLLQPAREFSCLYRLVPVRTVRDVRVTIPATPGFMKALRLSSFLGLPVRLVPGQPSDQILAELAEAADFYLHDPAVEAPIECFHSLLAAMRHRTSTTLWEILEHDPALFTQHDAEGRERLPQDFVATHLGGLLQSGAECASCRWQQVCAGYFKWPDPSYLCAGVQRLFAGLEAAAEEIRRDLAIWEPPSIEGATP